MHTIPESLAHFHVQPDDSYTPKDVVKALLGGVSDATLYRWANADRIPKPVKIGPRRSAWHVGALREALARLAAAAPALVPTVAKKQPVPPASNGQVKASATPPAVSAQRNTRRSKTAEPATTSSAAPT